MRHFLLVWLGVTWAGCGVAAEAQRAPAPPPENSEMRTGANSPPVGGNPLWDIPLSLLTATQERPIFLPSRRRPAAAPPPPISVPPEQLPLKLLGTVVGGDKGIAICLNQSNNSVIHVVTDEAFQGWILRSVDKREAVFEKASRRAVLTLPSPQDSLSAGLTTESAPLPPRPSPPAAATPIPSPPPGSGT